MLAAFTEQILCPLKFSAALHGRYELYIAEYILFIANNNKLLTSKQDGRKMSFQGLSIFHLHQAADPNKWEFQWKDTLLQMILIMENMKMPTCLQIIFKVCSYSVDNWLLFGKYKLFIDRLSLSHGCGLRKSLKNFPTMKSWVSSI